MAIANRNTAPRYTWGVGCEGWRLLDDPGLSVIEERMPPNSSEVRHMHRRARQVFFVLEGRVTLDLGGTTHVAEEGDAIAVPPLVPHTVRNDGPASARFLVISAPSTRGDRHPV